MLVNFYKTVQKFGHTVAEPTIPDTRVRQRLQTAAGKAVHYNQISPVSYLSILECYDAFLSTAMWQRLGKVNKRLGIIYYMEKSLN